MPSDLRRPGAFRVCVSREQSPEKIKEITVRIVVLALLLAPFIEAPLLAETIFNFETLDTSGAQVDTSTVAVGDSLLKIDGEANDGSPQPTIIFRGDLGEMLIIDHAQESYFILDGATMAGIAAQLNQFISQLQAQLAQLPEDQRVLVEQTLSQSMGLDTLPPTIEVTASGESMNVGGYDCAMYSVLSDGVMTDQFCIASWANFPANVATTFQEMTGFFVDISSAVDSGPLAGSFTMVGSSFTALDQVDGFPVLSRDFEDGVLVSESLLTSTETAQLDPGAYDPPANYVQQTIELPTIPAQ